jgi:hypothetical protein
VPSTHSRLLTISQDKSGNDPDFAKLVQAAADKNAAVKAKETGGKGQEEPKK